MKTASNSRKINREYKPQFAPEPGKYEGKCSKCHKLIKATEDDIVLSGNPPEFPYLALGHCGLALEMKLVTSKPKKKSPKS